MTRIAAKIYQSARIFSHRVHETIQDMSYYILKAVLSSLLCVYQVRFCFCYHSIGWHVERPYELMIDFCSDPSHTSSSWTPAIDNRKTEVIKIKFSIRVLSKLSQPFLVYARHSLPASHDHGAS